jgi:hypothetical protein
VCLPGINYNNLFVNYINSAATAIIHVIAIAILAKASSASFATNIITAGQFINHLGLVPS